MRELKVEAQRRSIPFQQMRPMNGSSAGRLRSDDLKATAAAVRLRSAVPKVDRLPALRLRAGSDH